MSIDRADHARQHLERGVVLRQRLADECVTDLLAAVDLVAAAMGSGGKLMICGNGGSAADSQHLAAEFVGQLSKENRRRGLPALALTTDTSAITATANDFGYEQIFSRQVEALGRPGDVLLGITTSGGSKNVMLAMRGARAQGISVIALCGQGGPIVELELADVAICVPSTDTQLIQEAHLTLEHLLCELVEQALVS